MIINILSQPIVATSISIFTMICFAIALLLTLKNWRENKSVFIVALVLFINFVLANNALVELLSEPAKPDINFYLRWVEYEAFSIVAIVLIHLVARVKIIKVSRISMWLLLLNTCYYFAMHVDIMINANREPWLLWTLYTPVVTLVELSIAVMLCAVIAKEKLNKTFKKTIKQ